jgi:hypothetical protein
MGMIRASPGSKVITPRSTVIQLASDTNLGFSPACPVELADGELETSQTIGYKVARLSVSFFKESSYSKMSFGKVFSSIIAGAIKTLPDKGASWAKDGSAANRQTEKIIEKILYATIF